MDRLFKKFPYFNKQEDMPELEENNDTVPKNNKRKYLYYLLGIGTVCVGVFSYFKYFRQVKENESNSS